MEAPVHADLVAISNVWQADSAVDRLEAEIAGLARAEARTAKALEEAAAAEAIAVEARNALQQKVRVNQRELDTFGQLRDRTRRAMEDGSTPNYAAAERQLAQSAARIDQLETEGLELLEALDAATAAATASTKAREKAKMEHDEAVKARAARDAAARAELVPALAHQAEVAHELPRDWRSHYSELRRKHRQALVNVVEGACVVCQTRVPPHRTNEVTLSRATHVCTGCGGFILP